MPVIHGDAQAREILLAGGERVGYDLLLGVPPHRAPAAVSGGRLASESGFLAVDRSTLATQAVGVFAIGDVTAIPIAGGKFLPKAGVFAHGQAEVVARRIAAEVTGEVSREQTRTPRCIACSTWMSAASRWRGTWPETLCGVALSVSFLLDDRMSGQSPP